MIALRIGAILAASLTVSGCSVFGASTVDEPNYTTVFQEDSFEIRQYSTMVFAETVVEKSYDAASDEGFRRLFKYISGSNITQTDIAMTAPVLMENENSIEKKPEVFFEDETSTGWKVSFVLPANFTIKTAPAPESNDVVLREQPGKRVAVNTFSGRFNPESFANAAAKLQGWIEQRNEVATSPPRAAAYNPPWTIPMLRRNEVHLDIQ